MEKKTAVFLMIILVFLTISAISVVHFFYTTFKVVELEMHASVGDRLGINVDNDKIWFGMVKGSATATKRLHIKNDLDKPILVKFIKSGPVADYITMQSYKVRLEPKEAREIGISVQFPLGTPLGNYTGTLKVLFKKNIF